MPSGLSPKQFLRFPWRIVGLLLLVAVGPLCWYVPAGDDIQRLSFDLPFAWRQTISTPEVAIVYLDQASAEALGQPIAGPWDRSLYSRLLDRLTRDGAKMVYFDLFFGAPGANPAADQGLADAIARNGHVILAGSLDAVVEQGVSSVAINPPIDPFLKPAAAWGLVKFKPDPDNAVRQLYTGEDEWPSASWAAAQLLNAPVTSHPEDRLTQRWMNYYGAPGTIDSVNFYQALQEDGVAPDFFKNRVVFIGGRWVVGPLNESRELFANPYSRWGRLFITGVEVHATEFLNLTRGDWLKRMPPWLEFSMLLAFGVATAFASIFLPPTRTLLAGLAAALVISCAAFWLQWYQHIWFDWLVPVAVQIPLGIIWCAGTQYFEEARKRAALRQAFSLYLSPHMADRIANSDFDLKPGGKVVEATIVFTDCQGFTAMTEELNDPVKVSETLIAYFTHTSKCVLDNDGIIIKYIGDSVMAAWGAPIVEKDHPIKAALAACQMQEASKIVVLGRALRTRLGICTGEVLAGNLGSPYRFDYTMIGDTTNFASRLEGLNKVVKTSILISDSTQKRLGDRFITRLIGHFALAGKAHGLPIHELICPASDSAIAANQWVSIFAEAIEAVKTGAFDQAKVLFRKTLWERGGEDGPSEFYLKQIAQLEKENALQEWTGVVKLTQK